jgi:hypothetical protein
VLTRNCFPMSGGIGFHTGVLDRLKH